MSYLNHSEHWLNFAKPDEAAEISELEAEIKRLDEMRRIKADVRNRLRSRIVARAKVTCS